MSPQRLFDIFLSLLLAPFALAVMAAVWVLYRTSPRNAGPLLYRGERMGKDKKLFKIYKIRTLVPDAEKKVGKSILAVDNDLTLTYGKFLRNTRLDELPQVLNVLTGDMAILGPRSVRPAAYEKERDATSNYDDRFRVKPGLIGYSQVLTPHAAPRRIRSLIDNRLGRTKRASSVVLFGLYTFVSLVSSVFLEAFSGLKERASLLRFGVRRANQRRMRRKSTKEVRLEVRRGPFFARGHSGRVVDMNHGALAVVTSAPLESNQEIEFVLRYKSRHRDGQRRAICRGTVYRKNALNGSGETRYVLSYEPVSPWNRYLIDCYVLELSIGLLKWRHFPRFASLFQSGRAEAESAGRAPQEVYYSEERVFQP